MRGPLAVNLASLAVALLAVFFFAGGRIFSGRDARTAGRWPSGRAGMRGQGPRHIGAKTAEIRHFFQKSRKSAHGGGGAGKGHVSVK